MELPSLRSSVRKEGLKCALQFFREEGAPQTASTRALGVGLGGELFPQ